MTLALTSISPRHAIGDAQSQNDYIDVLKKRPHNLMQGK